MSGIVGECRLRGAGDTRLRRRKARSWNIERTGITYINPVDRLMPARKAETVTVVAWLVSDLTCGS